jgi:hypothetical protein
VAVDADVYRLSSLLDAFGLYASYRKKNDPEAAVGAEGTVSAGQLFFYQDRYFVRLQVTGTPSLRQEVFLTCARAIARNLPGGAGRPKELEALLVPAVAPKSVRYLAQSLLGYEFFRRGLMAEAVVDGETVQLFLVPEESREAARTAFDRYQAYLRTAGTELRVTEGPERTALTAVDPLYGTVLVEQAGRFLVGAIRVRDAAAASALVGQIRRRVDG